MSDEQEIKIDEELYSRQLYVLGHEAMKKMMKTRVLVVGLDGLGQEIAKDLCLAGIRVVNICDPCEVRTRDLGAGFYFSAGAVGQPRDRAVLEKLQTLNRYVSVDVEDCGSLQEYEPAGYDAVIAVNQRMEDSVALGKRCHERGVKFVLASVSGVFSQIFVDFGKHLCVDKNGAPPCIGGINDISADGVLTLSDGSKHTLETGDKIKVGKEVYAVEVLSRIELRLLDFKGIDGEMPRDFEEVKDSFVIEHKSIADALGEPDIVCFDDIEKASWLHALFSGEELTQHRPEVCEEEVSSSTNEAANSDRAEAIGSPKKMCLKTQGISIEDSRQAKVEKLFSSTRGCVTAPMCSIIGGFAAQEALKAVSGKFIPLKQFFYFDYADTFLSLLPGGAERAGAGPSTDDRYFDARMVFSDAGFESLKKLRIFLVGAGAIGCEHLKNFVMTGIGLEGQIAVTDMDSIEQSNLNRQFLFKESDVSKLKSESAARQAGCLNEDYAGDDKPLVSYNLAVNEENESVFSDVFFDGLDIIANALDNVEARHYMDQRAVTTRTALVDSGTLGTKGHVQVVVPFATESYSATVDTADASIPMCTIKSYPSSIEHTIEWALGEFKTHFEQEIEPIKNTEDCIKTALGMFVNQFSTQIQNLLSTFPADHITKEGVPFWAPPKRPPTPISFNVNDKTHLLFIHSCANLYATCYGISHISKDKILAYIDNVFSLSEPSPIRFDENSSSSTTLPTPMPIIYDKDSWHADFIYACANLRARNYKIKERSKLFIRGISGKIIPAIATTTAVVSGLAVMEMIKYALGKELNVQSDDTLKNSFLDLGMPFLVLTDPIPPRKLYYDCKDESIEYTEWSRIEVADKPLKDIIAELSERLGCDVDMASAGSKMIYWSSSKKYDGNLDKTVAEIVKRKDGQLVQYVDFLTSSDADMERIAVVFSS
ncbi:ubiquitin-activating enzyme E1 [Pancytospora philotis]|nr:ubiquitin-activating enzyme E1 [Pancytospora philotis]